jgi:hypothetical protein
MVCCHGLDLVVCGKLPYHYFGAYSSAQLGDLYQVSARTIKPDDVFELFSTMRTTSPTTRSAHAFAHFIKADGYTAVSGFVFLGRCNPADPLVAR